MTKLYAVSDVLVLDDASVEQIKSLCHVGSRHGEFQLPKVCGRYLLWTNRLGQTAYRELHPPTASRGTNAAFNPRVIPLMLRYLGVPNPDEEDRLQRIREREEIDMAVARAQTEVRIRNAVEAADRKRRRTEVTSKAAVDVEVKKRLGKLGDMETSVVSTGRSEDDMVP